MSDQLDKISKMPDVAAYAGVGDGTVADAVTALIGAKAVAEQQRDELAAALESSRDPESGCFCSGGFTDEDGCPHKSHTEQCERFAASLAKLEADRGADSAQEKP